MTLAPLTQERLTNFLTTNEGLKYAINDDGEIGIPFENIVVWLTLKEALFNLRAYLRNSARIEDVSRVVELVETCNRDRTGPTAYWMLSQGSDGNQAVNVAAECSISMLEWTDEQLENFFRISMGQMVGFTTHLMEELPYLAAKDDE